MVQKITLATVALITVRSCLASELNTEHNFPIKRAEVLRTDRETTYSV
jgi:hypothetical protein